MSEKKLLQLLEEINLDKNTNLLPTTLKDGITCLGVEGETKPLSLTEDATATASDIALGVTAYINNTKVEGTVNVVEGSATSGPYTNTFINDEVSNRITIDVAAQEDVLVRAAGILQTHLDYTELASEIGLTADKIVEGNSILDIVGTVKPLSITSDANATAEDIVVGKSAYVNGVKLEGTIDDNRTGGFVTTTSETLKMENQDWISQYEFSGKASQTCVVGAGNTDLKINVPYADLASTIGLSADIITKGNNILGIEGAAIVEDGTLIYATVEDLQTSTGKEGQFAIVDNGTTFDGAYKYIDGAWVEMFSARRYDNTLTPEEYAQAVETATAIKGGNE